MRDRTGLIGLHQGGMEGSGEMEEAGELGVGETSLIEGLLQGTLGGMRIVDPEALRDAPLTVTCGDVEEDKTGPHLEVVGTLALPVDPPRPDETWLEMMDLLTGVKDLRVVESVAPRLEMIDLEIDQLVNKTTAGPRLSVNPVPIKRSFGGRICADILVTILQNHSLEVEVNSLQDSLGWSDQ